MRSRLELAVAALGVAAVLVGFSLLAAGRSASANQPNANLEYTLHVGSCNTAGDQKGNCAVTQGSTFVASMSLDVIPGPYDLLEATIAFTGVTSNNDPDMVWPDCVLEAISPPTTAGCAIGIGMPSSTFTGAVFTASFNCLADGTLSLVHGPADTLLIDANGKSNTETGPDVLNIDCAPPTVTPTPTRTPTPEPIGGISFEAGGGSSGVPSMLLMSMSLVLFGVAAWCAAGRSPAR